MNPSFGRTYVISDSFTRPANTTQYTAGDVVNDLAASPTAQTISVGREIGGGGVIESALLIDAASQATKGDFEVWLFDTAVTPQEDNAAFDPTDAQMATCVGVIAFGSTPKVGLATAGATGNCVYTYGALSIPFRCAATVKTL